MCIPAQRGRSIAPGCMQSKFILSLGMIFVCAYVKFEKTASLRGHGLADYRPLY